jgi:hypothetical protein
MEPTIKDQDVPNDVEVYCPICQLRCNIVAAYEKTYHEPDCNETTDVYALECLTCPDLIECSIEVGRRENRKGG